MSVYSNRTKGEHLRRIYMTGIREKKDMHKIADGATYYLTGHIS